MLRQLKLRIRAWRAPADVEDELRSHLEQLEEAMREEGLAAHEATRAARLRFGNPHVIRDESRDVVAFRWIEETLADARYAVRTFRHAPVLVVAATVSIGLAIGANTAILAFADALLLRPLAVHEPDALVRIVNPNATEFGFPASHYDRLRRLDGAFSGVAAIYPSARANAAVNGLAEARPAETALITANYFDVLGIEARAPAEGTATISDAFWQRRFGRDRSAIEGTIAIGNARFTIAAIAPRGFAGDQPGRPVDAWLPLTSQRGVLLERSEGEVPWLRVIARLRPGVTAPQAQATAQSAYLAAIAESANLRPALREEMRHRTVAIEPMRTGFEPHRARLRVPLALASVLALLTLLIACANVANLLSVKAAARASEFDMRLALGATRARLARQLVTEALLIALAGGCAGVLLAHWAAHSLTALIASGIDPVAIAMPLDARMLLIASAVTFGTAILFGSAPAWLISSSGLARSSSLGSGPALAAAQFAIAFALTVCAGCLVLTLHHLRANELGFERDHVLLVWTAPEQAGLRGPAVAELFQRIPQQLNELDGVASASASLVGPLEGSYAAAGKLASPNVIAPGFFETAGMRVVAGRDFTRYDTADSAPVGIVNQAFARDLFGGAEAVGRSFEFRRAPVRIVGVVSDTRFNSARDASRRMFFIPSTQDAEHLFSMCVLVRAKGDAAALALRLREDIRRIAPALPVVRISTLAGQLEQTLLVERLTAALARGFGALAILLAAVGMHAVISFAVSRRAREFAVRMALGATGANIRSLVVSRTLAAVGIGIVIGLPLALLLSRLGTALLYQVDANVIPLAAGVAVALTLVALVAAWRPARVASRIAPARMLRRE